MSDGLCLHDQPHARLVREACDESQHVGVGTIERGQVVDRHGADTVHDISAGAESSPVENHVAGVRRTTLP